MFLKWARRDLDGLQYMNVLLATSHREPGQKTPRQHIVAYLGGGYTHNLTPADPYWDTVRARFWKRVTSRLSAVPGMTADEWLRFCHEIERVVPLPAGYRLVSTSESEATP